MGEFDPGYILNIGNMFGGKSLSMIQHAQRAVHAGKIVQAFKIAWDERYNVDNEPFIYANGKSFKFPAIPVLSVKELRSKLKKNVEVLIWDEEPFFDETQIEFIEEKKEYIQIVGTGLFNTFRGGHELFPLREEYNKDIDAKSTIKDLIDIADVVNFFRPLCNYTDPVDGLCGKSASFVQRYRPDGTFSRWEDQTVIVGGDETYFPRCKKHFIPPQRNA